MVVNTVRTGRLAPPGDDGDIVVATEDREKEKPVGRLWADEARISSGKEAVMGLAVSRATERVPQLSWGIQSSGVSVTRSSKYGRSERPKGSLSLGKPLYLSFDLGTPYLRGLDATLDMKGAMPLENMDAVAPTFQPEYQTVLQEMSRLNMYGCWKSLGIQCDSGPRASVKVALGWSSMPACFSFKVPAKPAPTNPYVYEPNVPRVPGFTEDTGDKVFLSSDSESSDLPGLEESSDEDQDGPFAI